MRMFEAAFHLAVADLKQIVRRREIWLWTFVLPIVFFYFIGTITQGVGGGDGRDTIVLAISPDAGPLAGELAKHIEHAGYRVLQMSPAEAESRDRVVTVPAGFTASIEARQPVKLEFRHRDNGQSGSDDYDRVRLGKATYTLISSLGVAAAVNQEKSPLELVVQSAGHRKSIPNGFEQSVPGTMVFFLLLVLLTSGGALLVAEREQGILRRLASAPISRFGVVLAKWMARMMLASLQIVFCMLTGSLLFHVHWGGNVPMVLVVLFAYASMAADFGLFLGTIARTRPQVGAMGSLTACVLAALGGCWWPAEIMPQSVQAFTRWTPAGMAMESLHQLVNFGASPLVVIPQTIGLFTLALLAGILAAYTFRFQ